MKRLSAAAALLALAAWVAAPGHAAADGHVRFLKHSGEARFGQGLQLNATYETDEQPTRVEVLTRVPGESGVVVQELPVEGSPRAGEWQIRGGLETAALPNTTLLYRFRVTTESGEALSDEWSVTVTDDRFEWQTVQGRFVRLHYAEGDERFARRALEIGDDAVARISDLLGVEERDPIDFFVYGDAEAFQQALGPGTREYVAGRAVPEIRTLFALIEPNEIDSDWVDVVIAHELAHLVFDSAVENPYREPPHWLNEGLATYLSEGGAQGWTSVLEDGRRRGLVVPLSALSGKFPPDEERFRLGYAEGVSAVDFFVRVHGEERLVELVRSYARGLTDDEAFSEATGADFATFDAAWMAEIGLETPPTFGPLPAPSGPLPTGWGAASPTPTRAPGTSALAGATAGATDVAATDPPAPAAPGADGDAPPVLLLVGAAALAAAGLGLVALALRRGGAAGC